MKHTATVLAVVFVLACLAACVGQAFGHEQYTSWRRAADNFPCCGDHDCYETEARYRDGIWWALRREDKKWLAVPQHLFVLGAAKDGHAHLCAPPPTESGSETVYCFMMEAMGG